MVGERATHGLTRFRMTPARAQTGRYVVWVLVALSCNHAVAPVAGTQLRMTFERRGDFYATPFPSDDLRRADGTIELTRFPNPNDVELVNQTTGMLADARGFAVSGGVFFSLDGPLDPAKLPALAATAAPGAKVFLVNVDAASPELGRRQPVELSFAPDGGPFGAKNLLALLPLQGVPLRPNTTYAAVVLRSLGDAAGAPLGVSLAMAQLAAGQRPPALPDAAYATYASALAALASSGVALDTLAGVAVFTTGDPTAQYSRFAQFVLASPPPVIQLPLTANEVFDDYCVFSSTVPLPDFQQGAPPYSTSGGGWATDADGRPALRATELANVVVTLPRRPMPAAGYPTVVLVRTGAGGDRPLVERGTQGLTGGPELVPGTGPALQFARAGFAGVSVDGPLGGRRDPAHNPPNEDYTIFNVLNPPALRDNIRQSALELGLLAHSLDAVTIDSSACPGAPAVARLDTARLAVFAHSMGATIAPLAVAFEPRYRAVILSGSGGSWIENVIYKQLPVQPKPVAKLLLGYTGGRVLTAFDPALTLVQWALEPADPQVYASRIVREPPPGAAPRHVLMLQGIVDHYILPRISEAMSLPLGLDLAGAPLDAGNAELADELALEPLLALTGHQRVALPASGNFASPGGAVTAVVVQHRSDGVEDGHEIAFQTDAAKHQYRCFLESWLRGTPIVPDDAAPDAPCP